MTELLIHVCCLEGLIQLLVALGQGKEEKHQTLDYRRRSALFASILFSIPILVDNTCWCQPIMLVCLIVSSICIIILTRKKQENLYN